MSAEQPCPRDHAGPCFDDPSLCRQILTDARAETADHPTREERYAAVLRLHRLMARGLSNTEAECTCGGWRSGGLWDEAGKSFDSHVAAALVAADPAPAQPDAGGVERAIRTLLPGLRLANYTERWSPSSPAVRALTLLCEHVGERVDPAGDLVDVHVPTAHPRRPEGEPAQCCDGISQELSRGGVPRETPDAALNDGEALAIVKRACDIECQSPGKHTQCSSHEPYRVLREALFRDTLAARAAQPVPAPVVSRGVAEVKAEALREAASKVAQYRNGATGRRAANADLFGQMLFGMADDLLYQQERRERADRLVRDALPTDDGADCCRERTTAGGCGCGS